jgi:hypothetical protein
VLLQRVTEPERRKTVAALWLMFCKRLNLLDVDEA